MDAKINPKYAKLDYFIESEDLFTAITNTNIETRWKSDQAPITINFSVNGEQRGRRTWKFNNSLLTHKVFKTLIKEEVREQKAIYAASPYNPDKVRDLPNKDFQIVISYRLFWETLLVTLRGKIITYSAKIKREAQKEEKTLLEKMEILEDRDLRALISDKEKEELDKIRESLEKIRKNKLQGTIIKSRAR